MNSTEDSLIERATADEHTRMRTYKHARVNTNERTDVECLKNEQDIAKFQQDDAVLLQPSTKISFE